MEFENIRNFLKFYFLPWTWGGRSSRFGVQYFVEMRENLLYNVLYCVLLVEGGSVCFR